MQIQSSENLLLKLHGITHFFTERVKEKKVGMGILFWFNWLFNWLIPLVQNYEKYEKKKNNQKTFLNLKGHIFYYEGVNIFRSKHTELCNYIQS